MNHSLVCWYMSSIVLEYIDKVVTANSHSHFVLWWSERYMVSVIFTVCLWDLVSFEVVNTLLVVPRILIGVLPDTSNKLLSNHIHCKNTGGMLLTQPIVCTAAFWKVLCGDICIVKPVSCNWNVFCNDCFHSTFSCDRNFCRPMVTSHLLEYL